MGDSVSNSTKVGFLCQEQEEKHSVTGIYHVMLRGINRQDIFEEPEDYWEFIRILFLLYNTFFLKDGGTPKVACLFLISIAIFSF